MKTQHTLLAALLATTLASSAMAQDAPAPAAVPEPPPLPPQVQSGEAMDLGEPEITIKQRGGEMVKEYRINGHLYAVKITPETGKPYYLIDADGDGNMEGKFFDLDNSRVLVPQWVIMRW